MINYMLLLNFSLKYVLAIDTFLTRRKGLAIAIANPL